MSAISSPIRRRFLRLENDVLYTGPAVNHLLEIKGLEISYGAVRAVQGVDIAIPENKIVALLGANGAGKSSVLLACLALVAPAAGSIRFRGNEITGMRTEQIVREGMTLTPEGRRVFPKLTVSENLTMGGSGSASLRRNDRQNRERVYDLFPRLRERSNQMAGTLSGGEQQMLAIGRSLMAEPKLLLLDEPSLGLAPNIVDQIFDLIVELNRSGVTILLVEQNAEAALEISHEAVILRTGTIAAQGPSEKLLHHENLEGLYFGV